MQEALIGFINDYGYVGIALLILIESVFPPIPSEVILLFGGFLTSQTEMNAPVVVIAATIGATIGAAVLYLIGRLLDREKIKRLFSGKFGKIMHLKPEDAATAETWFKRYEYKAVLICRCIPIVRSLISIPAGMAKMKPVPFFILTIIGTVIWNTIIVWIGVLAGDAWEESLLYLGWYQAAALAALLIAAVIVLYIIVSRKRTAKQENNKQDGD